MIYIATSAAAFPAAQREFARQFPAGAGAIAPELLAYFELRRDFEGKGAAGRSQEVLDSFRRLGRRYADPRSEARYLAWRDAKGAPQSEAQMVFSTFVLPHSYAFFGTAAGGGTSDARKEETGCERPEAR